MPTYDYVCHTCKSELEVMQKITEQPLKTCPKCQTEGLIRGPGGGIGIKFTGDGFYSTMYPPKGSGEPSKPATPPPPGEGCCPCGKNQCQ